LSIGRAKGAQGPGTRDRRHGFTESCIAVDGASSASDVASVTLIGRVTVTQAEMQCC